MQFDEFSKNNGTDENVIEDPNITRQRGSIAENAAKAGFKATPTASENSRVVDYVKDLGMESPEEIAARSGGSDIERALGPELAAVAERKKREMAEFNDALEQCGGEMTQEDFNMLNDSPDYEAMLLNPPDPLNSDLKKYTEEQIKRVKETATPEELAAMGLADNTNNSTNVAPQNNSQNYNKEYTVKQNNVIKMPEVENTESDEDEEIMREMEDSITPVVIPEIPSDIKETINSSVEVQKEDEIPVMETETTDNKPEKEYIDDPSGDIVNKVKLASVSDFDNMDIDKELEELDSDNNTDKVEQEKIVKEKLKKASNDIKQKIVPLAANIDISGFSISNKPVSITNSVDMAKAAHQGRTARWALFSSRLPIVMSEMSGTDIDKLVRVTRGRDFTTTELMERYTIFYNHILSPKPADVEAWLKTVSIMDVKHLYAAAYKASFDGINFLPYDCVNTRCNNGFITDNIPFEECVTYQDDDAKAKANEIYRSEPSVAEYKLYHSEVVPISNIYAFSFREPSIWDLQIAPLYLDRDWYEKMESPFAISTYVDKIFVIDQASKSIRPLNVKEYPGDEKKTLKAKILAIAKVTSTLTSDQFNLMSSYIEEINKPSEYVDYQIPEVICPKCKTKIEARPSSSAELLFTRHRLTSLANG